MINDRILEEIFQKSQNKANGIIDGIPFPYHRFSDYIPTIEKGVYSAILGSSGIGKSTLAREIYVYHILKFSYENNYPVRILYFALEDDANKIMKKMFMYYAFQKHGIELSFWEINSKRRALSEREKAILEDVNGFIAMFMDSLFIIDDCTSPNSIRDKCDSARDKGFLDGRHVIVICDNYANITPDPEDKNSQWEAIGRLSSQIVRLDFCKKRGYSFIAILQVDMDQEKHSFRAAGKQVSVASLEPSTASIAGNKGIVRDFHVMLGIFNPWRYEITRYPNNDGYNIETMRNHFRSVLLLKTNDGELPHGRLGLRFFGAPGAFQELPLTTEEEQLNLVYNDIEERERLKYERILQKKLFGA